MPLKTKSTDQIKRITFFLFHCSLSLSCHELGISPHRVFYCFIKDYLLYYKTRENINWIVLSSFFGKAAYNNLEICFNLIFLLLQNISLFCWFFSPSHFEPHFTGSVIFNNGRSDIDHFPHLEQTLFLPREIDNLFPILVIFAKRMSIILRCYVCDTSNCVYPCGELTLVFTSSLLKWKYSDLG